jgi:transglutaminase-like putative cysteine protease
MHTRRASSRQSFALAIGCENGSVELTGIGNANCENVVVVIVSRASALGQLEWIPDGPAGTRVTLEKMRALARKGATHPMVIETAQRILRDAGVPPRSAAALRALFEWVRDHIRFQRDPQGIEQLSWPHRTLEKGHEDCDGKITLLAALARAAGVPGTFSFRAIGTQALRPGFFEHVYGVARARGVRIALDPTYAGTRYGWEYPHAVCAMEVAA